MANAELKILKKFLDLHRDYFLCCDISMVFENEVMFCEQIKKLHFYLSYTNKRKLRSVCLCVCP